MKLGKRRSRKLLTALLVLIIALVGGSQTGLFEKGVNEARLNQPGLYEVEEVSDGDTIIVNMNGRREIVRIIGVDTPETVHPDRPVECYGEEAAKFSRGLMEGKKVRMEADPLNTNRDRYSRLLRHIYLPDRGLAAKQLILEGYGFSYTLFPFEKRAEFDAYELQAKTGGKGLWSACQITVEANGAEKTNPASPSR